MALNDQYVLAQSSNFQSRVQASMVAAAVSISNEGWGVAFHRERAIFAVTVLGQQGSSSTPGLLAWTPLFANYCGTDTNCISDATQAGTVTLSSSNVTTQQALVTDAHINAAVSAAWNSFIREPNS